MEKWLSKPCKAKFHSSCNFHANSQCVLVFINPELAFFAGQLPKFINHATTADVMKVFIERESTTKKIKFNGTVSKLLKQLRLNPAAVLVAKNNNLVTEEDELNDKDEVKILSVISGG